MKKTYLPILLLIFVNFLFIGVVLAQNGQKLGQSGPVSPLFWHQDLTMANNSAKTQALNSIIKPLKSLDESFNDTTQAWEKVTRSVYAYNSQGLMESRLYKDTLSADTFGLTKYRYNAASKKTNTLYYAFNPGNHTFLLYSNDSIAYDSVGNTIREVSFYLSRSNVYRPSVQTRYTFDAKGNRTLKSSESWDTASNAWQIYGGTQSVYGYTATGNLSTITTSTYNSSDSTWYLYEKDTFPALRSNGEPVNAWVYRQAGGSWVLRQKLVYNPWNNWYNANYAKSEPKQYTIQGNGSGTFTDSVRQTFTYDGFGGVSTLRETRQGGAWSPSSRQASSYDAKGNYLGYKAEINLGTTWRVITWIQIDYTYDANNNLTQKLTLSYNSTSQALDSSSRQTFSDFQPVTISGNRNRNAQTSISVWPNPSERVFNLSLPGYEGEVVTEIRSISGQPCFSQSVQVQNEMLALEPNLPHSGLYLLTIRAAGQAPKTIQILKK